MTVTKTYGLVGFVAIFGLLSGTSFVRNSVAEDSQIIEYHCEFQGGEPGKTGNCDQNCRATGIFSNRDDFKNRLKLVCGANPDDDRGYYEIYDDGVHVRFEHETRKISIEGRNSVRPTLLIEPEINESNHPADLAFTWSGVSYNIAGQCRFHPRALPSPSP